MPRKKRTSRILEKAELPTAGLKAIDSGMNFGDTSWTLTHYDHPNRAVTG